jgi:cytochrome c5/cytochrome c553
MNNAWVVIAALASLILAEPAFTQVAGAPSPDVGAGKKRAAVCFACHGADGTSVTPGVPHLSGQDRLYLEKALHAYREGQTRQDPTMTAMAKPLSDSDISNIAAFFSLQSRMSDGQTAAQLMETMERLRPFGVVHVAASAGNVQAPATATAIVAVGPGGPAAVSRSGESIFNTVCTACHTTGAAGAPKLGDKAAWSSRLAEGKDTLYQHALHGFKVMPAKGTCTDCSDEEIKAAVDYMVSKAR